MTDIILVNYKFVDKLIESEKDPFSNPPATAVFFGDSVTKGCFEIYMKNEKTIETVYEPWNSYSAKFLRIMNTLYPRAQCNVINSGISGDYTKSAVARLERDVLSRNPDLVVVCFGLNDCSTAENAVKYGENLRIIFKEIQAAGIDCIFMTPNMLNTYVSSEIKEPLLKNIGAKLAESFNSGVFDVYMDRAARVAAEEGVMVCDCYTIWKTLYEHGVDTTLLLSNRLNHPQRDFHLMFAYELVKTLMIGKNQ